MKVLSGVSVGVLSAVLAFSASAGGSEQQQQQQQQQAQQEQQQQQEQAQQAEQAQQEQQAQQSAQAAQESCESLGGQAEVVQDQSGQQIVVVCELPNGGQIEQRISY